MGTPLTNVAKATAAVARAEGRLEELRRAQYEAIREAYAAGESVALIAQVAGGVTRQRIHQIIREAPADSE